MEAKPSTISPVVFPIPFIFVFKFMKKWLVQFMKSLIIHDFPVIPIFLVSMTLVHNYVCT